MTKRVLSPVAILVLVAAGCAHIEQFQATPRNACMGSEIQVSWEAKGRVSLAATPDLPNTGPKASTGSEAFIVEQPTTFELSAKRLLKDAEPVALEIDVAPPQHTFGAIAQCSQDDRLISTEMELQNQLSPGFTISKLENVLDREVRIAKDERQDRLPGKGDQGAVLAGLPVLGSWRLTSPLAAQEDCNSALRSIRQRLSVKIHLSCGD